MDVMLTPRIVPAAERKDFRPLPLDSLIDDLSFFPPAFELIPRLLLLLDDPESNCEDLADVIRIDPGLTNVLRISHSVSYGGALIAPLIYTGNIFAYRLGHGNGFPRYVVERDAAIVDLIGLEPHKLYRYKDEVEEMLRREQDRFQ